MGKCLTRNAVGHIILSEIFETHFVVKIFCSFVVIFSFVTLSGGHFRLGGSDWIQIMDSSVRQDFKLVLGHWFGA